MAALRCVGVGGCRVTGGEWWEALRNDLGEPQNREHGVGVRHLAARTGTRRDAVLGVRVLMRAGR